MLGALTMILAVLWLLGIVTSHTLGGFIHILIVLAILSVAAQLVQAGRSSR